MTAPGRPATGWPHYLREVVYGANDGVVTTLAVAAGATGAGFAPVVAVVLGAANLVADGISMGASAYLALKSELEQRGASVAAEKPLRHGLATFASFVAFGAVPLAALALPLHPAARLATACALAALALAALGAARAPLIRRTRPRSAGEMLAVAAVATAAAYVVGAGVARVVG